MASQEQYQLTQSPFVIPHEDVEALGREQGFQLLRTCLAHDATFCAFHASTSDDDAKATWLLHRDILHALNMPVVQLFRRAVSLAQAALCTNKHEDLELAFSGDARGAFVSLQCFLGEEDTLEWCCTSGCPGCIITATLSTESHLRLTIAASLLSTASIATPPTSPAASASSSPATSPTTESPPEIANTPTLPPLPHILPALRAALASDPFWGPDYWPYLVAKASQLSGGMQALITSCGDLEALIASPDASRVPLRSTATMAMISGLAADAEKGAKLKKSKLAKRQLRMKGEEAELLRRCALQCWARAAVPSRLRGEVLGVVMEGRGRRGSA